ncbi:MAG: hypothetical protein ACRDQ5_23925 [Sciscionella sp.]
MSTEDHSDGRDTVCELRDLLAQHRKAITEGGYSEFLDVDFALSLHHKLDAVLDRWDSFGQAQRGDIARTVRYVADTDDEEHDLRSPIGFIDDGEQVVALLRAVAPDLLR